MIGLPPSVRIFVATAPVDMRKSFDALSAMALRIVGMDPRTGHLFVFFSKHRDRVKILFWDRSGFCLMYKRLEQGTQVAESGSARDLPSGSRSAIAANHEEGIDDEPPCPVGAAVEAHLRRFWMDVREVWRFSGTTHGGVGWARE
jgi:transposase